MKRTLSLALAFVMTLSLLAGCGKSGDTNTPSPDAVSPSASAAGDSTPSSESTPPADEGPVVRDVVNIAVAQDDTWDPFNYSYREPVGVFQYLGYLVNGEYQPGVMKDNYKTSDDGLTITCEIYDNIYDSAGNHMTAADIEWSYNQAVAGTTLTVDGVCKECVATGDYTFEFHLVTEMQVGKWMSFLNFPVCTQKAYEDSPDQMATDPVGTGPYIMKDYTSGYSWTYEKRDDFWQTDETQISNFDKANVQTIKYFVIPQSTSIAIALEDGSIDMSKDVAAADLGPFENSDTYWLEEVPANISLTLMPNCDPSSPMSDVNLRLAVFYAINTDAILSSVYDGKGAVNHSFAPDWAVGYDKAWASLSNYYTTYDVAKAKEYLEKSSYNGEELTIMIGAGEAFSSSAQIIQGFLSAVGIKSKIATFDNALFNTNKKVASEYDMFLSNESTSVYWVNGVNSMLTYAKTGGNSSINFITDPELKSMLAEYMIEKNATAANLSKLNDYLLENAFCYSMINIYNYIVLPDWCTATELTYKKAIVPNGATYTEA